jgi:hypothetical protein
MRPSDLQTVRPSDRQAIGPDDRAATKITLDNAGPFVSMAPQTSSSLLEGEDQRYMRSNNAAIYLHHIGSRVPPGDCCRPPSREPHS